MVFIGSPASSDSVGTAYNQIERRHTRQHIYIGSEISMRSHVAKTVSSCFAALRQLRSIKRSISRPVLQSLVVSMVLSRLDYGSGTLAGIPNRLMDRLQSVLNAAAQLVFSARKYDHITPLLRELHWLSYPERIAYRLAVPAFRCQRSLAPSYLSDELRRATCV